MDAQSRREKKQWQAQQRAAARAAFPFPDEHLARLFEHVTQCLESGECDHTLRFTAAWVAENESSVAVLQWLSDQGGYCDCEVEANARDHWEQNRLAEKPRR